MHIRKTIIISRLPALPWDLLDANWKLNSAGPGAGTCELDSRVLGQLWQEFPHPPSPTKNLCQQYQPKAGPGTHTLVSPALTLGSAPGKGRGAVLRGNKPDPGPAPCVAEGSSAATKACRTATGLCDNEPEQGGGEGTSKHSSSLAHVGCWGLPPKSWLEGTQRAQGKEGFNPAHSKMFPTQMGRLGQAKSQLLQLSSRQMARIFLKFPARWACRPSAIHRSTGGSSAIWARWLEYRVLKPTGRGKKGREDHCREERGRWQISCFFQQRDIICVVLRCEG